MNNLQENTEKNSTPLKNKDKDLASEIYKKLAIIVGEDRVSKSRLERLLYSHDLAPLPKEMSLAFKTVPDVVVKPRNALDVSRIIKYAIKNNIPITPRGGATWALGGAVPAFGGIVLDMGSMQEILEINKENLYVTVEPGVDWMTLHDRLLNKGLLIGAYPSSAPGASVAGWVNTGGVGIGSYKYGGVEQQIRSMEVVLPNGKIINTGWTSVVNNSSGYNLNSLFVGSEGTLGVITKITLKVFPAPEEIRPVSFVFSEMGSAAEAVYALTQTNILPYHISFLDGGHFDLLRELGKDAPGVGAMINMTFTGDKAVIDLEEEAATKIMAKFNGVKTSKEAAKHEWDERYFEAKSRRLGPGFLLGEGFCPVSRFSDMVDKSKEVLDTLKMKGAVVGMICDRSTVLFMTYAIPNEHKLLKSMASMSLMKKLTDKIFEVGGRPAGFGMIYSGNLKKMHGKGVHVMDDIKSAIDPHYIMNPGKLTESTTRFGIPIPGFAMDLGMNMMAILKRIMPEDKLTPPSKKEHETPPLPEPPKTEKPPEPIAESSIPVEGPEKVDSQKSPEPTETTEPSKIEKPPEPVAESSKPAESPEQVDSQKTSEPTETPDTLKSEEPSKTTDEPAKKDKTKKDK